MLGQCQAKVLDVQLLDNAGHVLWIGYFWCISQKSQVNNKHFQMQVTTCSGPSMICEHILTTSNVQVSKVAV